MTDGDAKAVEQNGLPRWCGRCGIRMKSDGHCAWCPITTRGEE